MKEKTGTVDAEEIERFSAMASEWWNPGGKFKPLHRMNPIRIQYIKDHVPGLGNASLLDIGCGGGLIAEPMARLGARVTAIDAGEKNIAVAKLHAQQSGVEIDYRCTTAEDVQAAGEQFDVVLALEIIEHVADVEAFVEASCRLLKPGGLIFYSTLNRTPKSYALAIVGAEYVLRWLPVGTHDWNKFLKPHELVNPLKAQGVEIADMTGMAYHPITQKWSLNPKDLDVNYILVGRKI